MKRLAVPVLALAACHEPPVETHHRIYRGQAMGSSLEIQVIGSDIDLLDRAIEAARGEIDRLDRMMTDWKDSGELMEINHNAGVRPVRVPAELFLLIRRAIDVSRLSGGAFDITWAGAGKLWKWWEKDPAIPTDEQIRSALTNVGWKHVVLDEKEGTVYLDRKGSRIGLGAIAPGYAGDLAIARIRALGIQEALVNLSGDVIGIGRNWSLAIKHPRRPGEAFASIPIRDRALSTSADSERFFVKNGRRYGHIIDPHTGRPADRCQSVTILAPTLEFADALATAVFVMGPESGMRLVESLEGVDALIVAADGTVVRSRGLK